MSIREAIQKIKTYLGFVEKRDIYGSILIVLVSISSFSLGRLSTIEIGKVPVTIENIAGVYGAEVVPSISREVSVNTIQAPTASQARNYVASKAGKKYYLPACSGVKRIKEENKIWFASREDAEAAGFTPASNCDGL